MAVSVSRRVPERLGAELDDEEQPEDDGDERDRDAVPGRAEAVAHGAALADGPAVGAAGVTGRP